MDFGEFRSESTKETPGVTNSYVHGKASCYGELSTRQNCPLCLKNAVVTLKALCRDRVGAQMVFSYLCTCKIRYENYHFTEL